MSVLADRALGPAAELILEYLEDQIEILWKLLLNRRVPGEQESPTTLYMKASISEALEKEVILTENKFYRIKPRDHSNLL